MKYIYLSVACLSVTVAALVAYVIWSHVNICSNILTKQDVKDAIYEELILTPYEEN